MSRKFLGPLLLLVLLKGLWAQGDSPGMDRDAYEQDSRFHKILENLESRFPEQVEAWGGRLATADLLEQTVASSQAHRANNRTPAQALDQALSTLLYISSGLSESALGRQGVPSLQAVQILLDPQGYTKAIVTRLSQAIDSRTEFEGHLAQVNKGTPQFFNQKLEAYLHIDTEILSFRLSHQLQPVMTELRDVIRKGRNLGYWIDGERGGFKGPPDKRFDAIRKSLKLKTPLGTEKPKRTAKSKGPVIAFNPIVKPSWTVERLRADILRFNSSPISHDMPWVLSWDGYFRQYLSQGWPPRSQAQELLKQSGHGDAWFFQSEHARVQRAYTWFWKHYYDENRYLKHTQPLAAYQEFLVTYHGQSCPKYETLKSLLEHPSNKDLSLNWFFTPPTANEIRGSSGKLSSTVVPFINAETLGRGGLMEKAGDRIATYVKEVWQSLWSRSGASEPAGSSGASGTEGEGPQVQSSGEGEGRGSKRGASESVKGGEGSRAQRSDAEISKAIGLDRLRGKEGVEEVFKRLEGLEGAERERALELFAQKYRLLIQGKSFSGAVEMLEPLHARVRGQLQGTVASFGPGFLSFFLGLNMAEMIKGLRDPMVPFESFAHALATLIPPAELAPEFALFSGVHSATVAGGQVAYHSVQMARMGILESLLKQKLLQSPTHQAAIERLIGRTAAKLGVGLATAENLVLQEVGFAVGLLVVKLIHCERDAKGAVILPEHFWRDYGLEVTAFLVAKLTVRGGTAVARAMILGAEAAMLPMKGAGAMIFGPIAFALELTLMSIISEEWTEALNRQALTNEVQTAFAAFKACPSVDSLCQLQALYQLRSGMGRYVTTVMLKPLYASLHKTQMAVNEVLAKPKYRAMMGHGSLYVGYPMEAWANNDLRLELQRELKKHIDDIDRAITLAHKQMTRSLGTQAELLELTRTLLKRQREIADTPLPDGYRAVLVSDTPHGALAELVGMHQQLAKKLAAQPVTALSDTNLRAGNRSTRTDAQQHWIVRMNDGMHGMGSILEAFRYASQDDVRVLMALEGMVEAISPVTGLLSNTSERSAYIYKGLLEDRVGPGAFTDPYELMPEYRAQIRLERQGPARTSSERAMDAHPDNTFMTEYTQLKARTIHVVKGAAHPWEKVDWIPSAILALCLEAVPQEGIDDMHYCEDQVRTLLASWKEQCETRGAIQGVPKGQTSCDDEAILATGPSSEQTSVYPPDYQSNPIRVDDWYVALSSQRERPEGRRVQSSAQTLVANPFVFTTYNPQTQREQRRIAGLVIQFLEVDTMLSKTLGRHVVLPYATRVWSQDYVDQFLYYFKTQRKTYTSPRDI